MKLNVKKFQAGGPMGGEAAPAPEAQGQDPLMQVIEMAQQAIQSKDCQMALGVCDMLLQIVQQSQGGAPGAAPAPEAQPTFARQGGKLVKRR